MNESVLDFVVHVPMPVFMLASISIIYSLLGQSKMLGLFEVEYSVHKRNSLLKMKSH